MKDHEASRRAVLLAGVTGLLTGCGAASRPVPPTGGGSATTTSPRPAFSPSRPRLTPPTPVQVTPKPAGVYQPLLGEEEPQAKVMAARVLQVLAAWAPGQAGVEAARTRLTKIGQDASLVEQVPHLIGEDGAATMRIVYPQYGGLDQKRRNASLMVVCEQAVWLPGEKDPTLRSHTIDVRVQRRGDTWVCAEFLPAAPGKPADAGDLDASVSLVLDNDRLRLPAAARADLLSGGVIPEVTALLQRLSGSWELDVCVVQSGHPLTVYGTDRPSNHTLGRAVDIWAIDGASVIERDQAAWRGVMEAAAEFGADEIGGPVDLDRVRGGRPYFSDAVHQDHVHLGFELPSASDAGPVQ